MKKIEIDRARDRVAQILTQAGIELGPADSIEITDFGKNSFPRLGLGLVIRVSEPEYASKWLVIQPGQACPNHYHQKIKETFFIIKGRVTMWVDGKEVRMKPGDRVTLTPGTWHSFTSDGEAVIEEVTNRQYPNDSIFEDETIQRYVTVED